MKTLYTNIAKPLLDYVTIITLSPLWIPLMLAISLIVKLTSKGPIFFKQKRIGKNKNHFTMLKFRTMKTDTPKDTPTHMLENPEKHITKTGKLLRKSSLDEIPQILNILANHMSIIGPRPALWNQDDLISERDKYGANNIRPGLTGWAQVNGRDELPIDVKAKYDGEYCEKISFRLDVKILLLTIRNVFKSEGVVEGGSTFK